MAHPVLLLLVVVLLLASPTISSSTKRIQPKFPAIFYFGDSIFDTGNNNYISTLGVANHLPYGRDFPPGNRPTGRFSNGRLVPDLLNEKLQLKEFSPPYLDMNLSDEDIMTGVNFASAGSGFDDRTSRLSNTLPLSSQVDLFEEYLQRLSDIAGDREASRIVTNSLIFINSGTNDFTRYYRLSRRMSIGEYQDIILGMVREYVKVRLDNSELFLPSYYFVAVLEHISQNKDITLPSIPKLECRNCTTLEGGNSAWQAFLHLVAYPFRSH
jgi:hypothetical protein